MAAFLLNKYEAGGSRFSAAEAVALDGPVEDDGGDWSPVRKRRHRRAMQKARAGLEEEVPKLRPDQHFQVMLQDHLQLPVFLFL